MIKKFTVTTNDGTFTINATTFCITAGSNLVFKHKNDHATADVAVFAAGIWRSVTTVD
jgi:hypothetical protein